MEEAGGEALVFTITDLKQYSYCPRVVFYTYCLPLIRPVTFKMEAGVAAHETARTRERRRTLAAYGLASGERHFDVWVESPDLGLRGRIDMVIDAGEGEARELIPVDYKQTRRRPGRHVKRQLAAYGLMLEESRGYPVRRGYLYYLPLRQAEEVRLTPKLCAEVRETLAAMRDMVRREAMPDPPRSRRPCLNCEFRRFCNDV